MKEKKNIIDAWLSEHGDVEINQFIDKNLAIVDKVRKYLKTEGISGQKFAEIMGKKPSEVSKWLSGNHNLTLKSIVKMECALGIELIHTEPVKEYEYVHLGVIKSREDFEAKKNNYEEGCSITIAV